MSAEAILVLSAEANLGLVGEVVFVARVRAGDFIREGDWAACLLACEAFASAPCSEPLEAAGWTTLIFDLVMRCWVGATLSALAEDSVTAST